MGKIGQYFGRKPLWFQIAVAASITTIVVIIAVVLIVFKVIAGFLHDDLAAHAEKTVLYLADATVEAVVLEDIPVLNSIVDQLKRSDPFIHVVRFVNEDGRELASYSMRNKEHQQLIKGLIPHSELEMLTRSQDIVVAGEKFGSLSISWHTGGLAYNIIDKMPRFILIIFIILMIVPLCIVAAVHFLAVRPIGVINRNLISLSSGGASSAQVPPEYVARDLMALNAAVGELDRHVTEHRHAELEIQRSEARLRAVFDNTPVCINLKDANGRYLFVNKPYEEWLGYTADEIIGKTAQEFLGDSSRVVNLSTAEKKVLESGEVDEREVSVTRPDGQTYHRILIKYPVKMADGSIEAIGTTAIDITERKQAEDEIRTFNEQLEALVEERTQALTHSVSRFRQAFDDAPIAIALIDLEGRRFSVNQALADFLGYTIEELENTLMSSTSGDAAQLERSLRLRQQVIDGEIDMFRNERQYQHKDGRIVWGEVCSTLVRNADDEPLHFIAHTIDITDRKNAESARQEAEAKLVQADKMATLGTLAAGIAHELNQPLNIIRMVADVARDAADDGAANVSVTANDLETIIEQIKRMAQIIDHMNVFSRKDSLSDEVFSPATVVRDIVTLVDNQFAAIGVGLDSEIDLECGFAEGAQGQLGQVILNLLTNARDAVELRATEATQEHQDFTGRINVTARHEDGSDNITISVTDNGGGIDGDNINRIFDPFFTTKDVGSGTGLGLSISHSIITAMGGTLGVENQSDGACFTVTLPRQENAPANDAPVTELPEPVKSTASGKASILIVDDEKLAVDLMARVLRKSGYEVATAHNGVEALESFRESPCDVVITDMRMPEMDGTTLIRHLHEIVPDLPIFILSGQVSIGSEVVENVDAPSIHMIKKPANLPDIINKIAQIMA